MKIFAKTIISKEEGKKFLNDITHASVWGSKIKYSYLNKTMSICGPADAAEVSLITGVGEYYDKDFDGCSSDKSHQFKVVRKPDGQLIKRII